MSGVVALGAGVPVSAGGTPTRRSPNLDAELATCRAQLADWVTCASAKTSEGKAKIEQITAKAEALKQQIAAATRAEASRSSSVSAFASASASASSASGGEADTARTLGVNRPSADPTTLLGSRIDLYA